MTPAELKTRIAQIMHRSDLATQLPNFVADANERINRRFGTSFVLPVDTDPLPAGDLLYLFAALESGYAFVNNGDNATYYSGLWEKECDRQNVLQPGTSTDIYTTTDSAGATVPPYIKPEST